MSVVEVITEGSGVGASMVVLVVLVASTRLIGSTLVSPPPATWAPATAAPRPMIEPAAAIRVALRLKSMAMLELLSLAVCALCTPPLDRVDVNRT